jgi:hypothetical protein
VGSDGPWPPANTSDAMLNRLGRFRSAVSRHCDFKQVRPSPVMQAFGSRCRSASSAFVQRSSCSYPGCAKPNSAAISSHWFSAKAAAAFAVRCACRRATAVGACSRGRHQRAASRRRPGCGATRQATDASGSSRWAVPARSTQIIASVFPSCHARGILLHAARHPGQSGIIDREKPGSARRTHASSFLSLQRRISRFDHTPPAKGNETAVPCNDNPPAERLTTSLATTR